MTDTRFFSTQKSILSHVKWNDVAEVVTREQASREKFNPSISVFRWWARRPQSLMGALLDAALEASENPQVKLSDPFSGGGTVAVEAAKRNLCMHAQDLYPWPVIGLQTTLSQVESTEFEQGIKDLLEELKPLNKAYRRRDGKTLSHIMRVRIGHCSGCRKDLYLFPDPMVTKAFRGPKDPSAFFGCQKCGHVHLSDLNPPPVACPNCHSTYLKPTRGNKSRTCPHCTRRASAAAFLGTDLRWKAVLVQELTENKKGFRCKLRLVEPGDPVDDLPLEPEVAAQVSTVIPDGDETRQLLNAGFKTWGDLYSQRQIQVLLTALEITRNLKVSVECQERIALAVLGMAEMPAYLCRWDRFHQKTFEAIANHHFAHTTFVVETNFLSPVGRGTLARRVISARKALEWRQHLPARPATRIAGDERLKWGVSLMVGSSASQPLDDEDIALTLTDPPYFNDVQYGELARLFHYWLGKYFPLAALDEKQEAVPNRSRGQDSSHYEEAITQCLIETRRTLKRDGRLILTFHNRKLVAWESLAKALKRSDFTVRALAVIKAENSADHSKKGGRGMLHDLVIECMPRQDEPQEVLIAHAGPTQEEQEILAVGKALVDVVGSRHDEQELSFKAHFHKELEALSIKGERIK